MVWLFYTTYISVDIPHHEIFRAKVGKGGIKFDTVKSGWSIVYNEASQVIISKKHLISFSGVLFNLTNIAESGEMLHFTWVFTVCKSTYLGSSRLKKGSSVAISWPRLVTTRNHMSQCMRFPTLWYVWPANPQISLHSLWNHMPRFNYSILKDLKNASPA